MTQRIRVAALEKEIRARYGSHPLVLIESNTDGCEGCLSVIVGNVMEVWVCPKDEAEVSFNTTLSEAVEAIEARLVSL